MMMEINGVEIDVEQDIEMLVELGLLEVGRTHRGTSHHRHNLAGPLPLLSGHDGRPSGVASLGAFLV
jgi:hypothetical protein